MCLKKAPFYAPKPNPPQFRHQNPEILFLFSGKNTRNLEEYCRRLSIFMFLKMTSPISHLFLATHKKKSIAVDSPFAVPTSSLLHMSSENIQRQDAANLLYGTPNPSFSVIHN